MNPLLIYHHLGLGDHIICNGLVRHFAEQRQVWLLCKIRYYQSVIEMYRDLVMERRIMINSVADDNEARRLFIEATHVTCMQLGGGGPGGFNSKIFDQEFYRQAGVPFEYRWSKFHVPEPLKPHKAEPEPYVFMHDDRERGMRIAYAYPKQDIPTCRPYHAGPITHWLPVLRNALEIHCIPSSFLCLVDSLEDNKAQKLVCHAYARTGCDVPTLRREWEVRW